MYVYIAVPALDIHIKDPIDVVGKCDFHLDLSRRSWRNVNPYLVKKLICLRNHIFALIDWKRDPPLIIFHRCIHPGSAVWKDHIFLNVNRKRSIAHAGSKRKRTDIRKQHIFDPRLAFLDPDCGSDSKGNDLIRIFVHLHTLMKDRPHKLLH